MSDTVIDNQALGKPWAARLAGWRASGALSVAALATALAPVQFAQAQARWDLPAAYPSWNYHTQLLEQFAKEVETLTQGKLAMTVHANASLYKAPEIKRAVQGGQVQIGEILLSNFANEDPVYELDSLPFLTSNFDEAWRLYQVQKPVLEEKLAAQGMLLLYSVPWPAQGFYTNRELNAADDMRGLKMRSQTPVVARLFELLGAQPITIQAADVSQAMATRIIEGMMASGSTGYDSKIYEYVDKFYNTQTNQPRCAVVVNRRAFDALDEATQQVLRQAAAKVEADGWELAKERTTWYFEQLEQKGLRIVAPSPGLMSGLGEVGKIMLAEWLKKAGPEGERLIAAYRGQN